MPNLTAALKIIMAFRRDMNWFFTCKTLHNTQIWFVRLTNPGIDSDSDIPC